MPQIILSEDQARLLSEAYPVQVLDPAGNILGHIEPVGPHADVDQLPPQAAFLRLPREERTRRLAEQAQAMKGYYEQSDLDRLGWQSGDFHDEN